VPKLQLQVAEMIPVTEAEGPGKRFALWVQGCPILCKACCNPQMLASQGGQWFGLDELLDAIKQVKNQIEGISLLGGEPFAQALGCAWLACAVQRAGLSVMVYSGYTLLQLRHSVQPFSTALLTYTDVLVDGPYERENPETHRRWIGSANQDLHFLSSRYMPSDQRFFGNNTLELHWRAGDLVVNGWPQAAKAFSK